MSSRISPTLSTLPSELVCHIFELTDSLQAALSFASCSKHFQYVWRDYNHSVYIALYPEALTLARLQHNQRTSCPTAQNVKIIQSIHDNANIVVKAGRTFVQMMRDENPFYFRRNKRGTMGFLKPVERDRFTHAYYRYWLMHVDREGCVSVGDAWHDNLDLRALFLVPTLLRPTKAKVKQQQQHESRKRLF